MDEPTAPEQCPETEVVGLIADTHAEGVIAQLQEAITEALRGVDLILHAGALRRALRSG